MSGSGLRQLLAPVDAPALEAILGRWRLGCRAAALAALEQAMAEEALVEERLRELPRKLADLLELFLTDPSTAQAARDVPRGAFQSLGEVEAALAALAREGFVFPVAGGAAGAASFAVPYELAECVAQLRRRQQCEIENTLTLRGFLNARYFDRRQREGHAEARAADHARLVHKLLSMQSSVCGRVDRLPEPVRRTWDVLLSRFGGIAAPDELAAALGEDRPPDLARVKTCLERTMLGTAAPLRLGRFGLQPMPAAVVAFHEVTLCELQRSDRDRCPAVEETLAAGVDLVSNVGRFLREIGHSRVQFTMAGNLYRASEKRIGKVLLAAPGSQLDAAAQLDFIFRFCLSRRLLDRSGERALRLNEAGQRFEQQPLGEKLASFLAYAVEERWGGGEPFHEVRLRRALLRWLRRTEAERWHELTWLPFLARNGYLAAIERSGAEAHFAARLQGGYFPGGRLPQLAGNLVAFIKRRLFPLGLVDLGLRGGRPVAMRLSRLGAELLGAQPSCELGGSRSQVVVNPDFEVLLFPGDDQHEVVHAFDRFAERTKTDHVHHFRLSRSSVRAALFDGITIGEVVRELTDRSRAPLPQNVRYSLDDWADEAGVLVVEDGVLRGRRAEVVQRFLDKGRVRTFVARRTSATTLELAAGVSFEDLRREARAHGFLVERRARAGDAG